MNAKRRALCKRLFTVSVVLSLILTAMALVLTGWGSLVLPGLSESLAEVAMEQGERREAAGNLKEAPAF